MRRARKKSFFNNTSTTNEPCKSVPRRPKRTFKTAKPYKKKQRTDSNAFASLYRQGLLPSPRCLQLSVHVWWI